MAIIKVRPFVDGEEDLVSRLHNCGFKEWIETLGQEYLYGYLSPEDISQWPKASPTDTLWIAELDDSPAGYAHCHFSKSLMSYVPTESDMGQSKVAVIPEYRQRGVGKALIQRTLEFYRSRGAKAAEAVTYTDNEAALKLLQGTGFVPRVSCIFAELDLKNPLRNIELNPEVVVREATEEDLKALVGIFIESADWIPGENISEQGVLSWLKERDTALIAEYRDQIVGLMAFDKNHGLHLMGVIPEYRRKGIGYTLFFYLLKHMQRKGHPKAIVDTGPRLKEAIKMYDRFGFKLVRKHYTWTKRLF